MTITIVRFETYPTDAPKVYVVGFNIVTENNRSFYQDTQVSFDQASKKSDLEICNVAYKQLQTSIVAQTSILEAQQPLLGKVFVPDAQA